LIESAGSFVAVGSMLEIQILNRREREASTGVRTGASDLLFLLVVCERGSLRKCLNGVGLNDVLETDCEALLSGFRDHCHTSNTIAA
jgi:hypothetical protein